MEEALSQVLGLPVVISFTVETDGSLPNGESLAEAIEKIDSATDSYPEYYMVNCAHPSHFFHVLDGSWTTRIGDLRANASAKCHEELDESKELDRGNPEALGVWYGRLKDRLPGLFVFGGCCGTDAVHVEAMCEGVTPIHQLNSIL